MVGLVKRIEQEISDLEIAIADASKKMAALRSQYIEVVSQAIAHQIILATYQLCTKEYPDGFLTLGLEAKQRLQHNIQVLAGSFSQKILKSNSSDLSSELGLESELSLKDVEIDQNRIDSERSNFDGLNQDKKNQNLQNPDRTKLEQINIDSSDRDSSNQNKLEKSISLILGEASEAIHQLLASEGLLSLPLAEDAPAIQLRLLDLELSNRQALSIRSELRVLDAKLQQLGAEITKKQKAKLVAEAELAWRATWIEWKQD